MSAPTHLLAAAFLLVSCASTGTDPRPGLVDIQDSAAPLAAWFDQEKDTPRAILLLSPV